MTIITIEQQESIKALLMWIKGTTVPPISREAQRDTFAATLWGRYATTNPRFLELARAVNPDGQEGVVQALKFWVEHPGLFDRQWAPEIPRERDGEAA